MNQGESCRICGASRDWRNGSVNEFSSVFLCRGVALYFRYSATRRQSFVLSLVLYLKAPLLDIFGCQFYLVAAFLC